MCVHVSDNVLCMCVRACICVCVCMCLPVCLWRRKYSISIGSCALWVAQASLTDPEEGTPGQRLRTGQLTRVGAGWYGQAVLRD